MDLINFMYASNLSTVQHGRASSLLANQENSVSKTKVSSILADKFREGLWGLNYQQGKKTSTMNLNNTPAFTGIEIPDIMEYTSVIFETAGEYAFRFVIRRPGALKVLRKLSKRCNIRVHSSDETLAKRIIQATSISQYMYAFLDSSFCQTVGQTGYLKNIWSQAVLVDDLASQARYQPENCIIIKHLEEEVANKAIYALFPFLKELTKDV
jgi:hypothetical protein